MRVLVFDVIETLLDLRALDPALRVGVRRAALQMTAERRGLNLAPDQQQRILSAVREPPPHPDVMDGLGRLRDAGFRMAALTNSTAEVAEAQLQYAGVRNRGW